MHQEAEAAGGSGREGGPAGASWMGDGWVSRSCVGGQAFSPCWAVGHLELPVMDRLHHTSNPSLVQATLQTLGTTVCSRPHHRRPARATGQHGRAGARAEPGRGAGWHGLG